MSILQLGVILIVIAVFVVLGGCALINGDNPPTPTQVNIAWLTDILAGLLNPADPAANTEALQALSEATGVKVEEIVKLAIETFQTLWEKNQAVTPKEVMIAMAVSDADKAIVEAATGRSLIECVTAATDTVRLLNREALGRGVDPLVAQAVLMYQMVEESVRAYQQGSAQTEGAF